MLKEKIVLKNEAGLHARPASELVKIANKYKSTIVIKYMDREVNAKSILAVMSLGIKANTQIELICSGEDEKEAMQSLKNSFENNFGE